jgi:antitoxin PrlF
MRSKLDFNRLTPYPWRMKSRVSSKGQITLPQELRDRLGLLAGTPVSFEIAPGGVLIRKGVAGAHPVDQIYGRLNLERPVDALLDETRGPRFDRRRQK